MTYLMGFKNFRRSESLFAKSCITLLPCKIIPVLSAAFEKRFLLLAVDPVFLLFDSVRLLSSVEFGFRNAFFPYPLFFFLVSCFRVFKKSASICSMFIPFVFSSVLAL
jgi:hypothetical protein